MSKLEVNLGDACFTVNINFPDAWPAKRWHDTTHFHTDSEIHTILEGNAVIEIGGKDVHIDTGDILLLAPQASHYPKSCNDTLQTTNFSFGLTRNDNHDRKEKNFSEYRYYSNIFKAVREHFIIHDAELLSIVQKLLSQRFCEENEHIYQAMLAVFFMTLAKGIREHHLLYPEQPLRIASENENSFKQRKTVEAFFQIRYNEEVSIEDLAQALCLSVPQTHRIVKKIFDEGFKKTLIKQRIEHACMLIKQQNQTLSEIACSCGYTSYNGFLSAFKSYTGKTPKEYEKNIR